MNFCDAVLAWRCDSPPVCGRAYQALVAGTDSKVVITAIGEQIQAASPDSLSGDRVKSLVAVKVATDGFSVPQGRLFPIVNLIVPNRDRVVASGVISGSELDVPHPPGTGLAVWFTGLSGAGKTTICDGAHRKLLAGGSRACWIDGDFVRSTINHDLTFALRDRNENIRRLAFIARQFARGEQIVLVSAISPLRAGRERARRFFARFLEVYVNAPLSVCEQRDVKGLYEKARRHEITNFTGIDSPYEPPLAPDVECNTDQESIDESVRKVLSAIAQQSRVPTGEVIASVRGM